MAALQHESKPGTRAGGKKSKRGCLTCKARRVKCDETQPECRRCITARFVCRGYKDIFVSSRTPEPEHPVAIDKSSAESIPPIPSIAFPNNDGVELFDFYRHELGSRLGGALEFEFWERLVLQLGQTEPAIHYGLAALSATFQVVNFSRYAQPESRICLLRESSLKFYNEALMATKQRTEAADSELVALVTCLLFLCIEFVHGNISRSLDLLPHGLGILRRYLHRDGSMQSHPEAFIIRHTIMPIYERLIVLSMMYGQKMLPLQDRFSESMSPKQNEYAALLTLRNELFRLAVEGNRFHKMTETWREGQGVDDSDMKQWQNEQRALQEATQLWQSSLWRCLNQYQNLAPREEQMKRTLLMWHANIVSQLQSDLHRDQSCFETHLIHFTSIVENAERLQEYSIHTASRTEFAFEMGSLPPLYHVLTKCRFPVVRAKALTLLSNSLRREGLWDREELLAIGTRIAELEELVEADVLRSVPVRPQIYDVKTHRERSDDAVTVTFSSLIDGNESEHRRWDEVIPLRSYSP